MSRSAHTWIVSPILLFFSLFSFYPFFSPSPSLFLLQNFFYTFIFIVLYFFHGVCKKRGSKRPALFYKIMDIYLKRPATTFCLRKRAILLLFYFIIFILFIFSHTHRRTHGCIKRKKYVNAKIHRNTGWNWGWNLFVAYHCGDI